MPIPDPGATIVDWGTDNAEPPVKKTSVPVEKFSMEPCPLCGRMMRSDRVEPCICGTSRDPS